MGFYQFGMEMVLSLNVASLRNFFSTFYRLPYPLAHGFLSHRLSSAQLLGFAFGFFVYGNNELRAILARPALRPLRSFEIAPPPAGCVFPDEAKQADPRASRRTAEAPREPGGQRKPPRKGVPVWGEGGAEGAVGALA